MKHGIIAAGHEATAEAAAIILKDGGNAFDAAIAAFFASFITEPCMSSAGGGAFANILTANGQSVILDFFCQTPRYKRPISEVEFTPMVVNFGETTETFHIGMGAIATPGMIAGIYHIHRHFATRPLSVLLEPALDIARNGVAMNDFQFFDIRVLEPIMTKEAECRNIFYPDGKPLPVGQMLKMPQLADYLEFLVKEGEREFYEGETAQKLTASCRERGGFLTLDDLKNYKVIERSPLVIPYRGKTILTNPFPSVGGTLLGFILRELETSFAAKPYELYSKGQVQNLQKIIGDVFEIDRDLDQMAKKWGSTSHFNIVDKWGNAINTTMSNGEGAGYMIPDTNIMMNNMLGEASLLPNGFHSWEADVRLSSMMSPTMVADAQGQFETAIGTGGGSRIPAAIAQVLHYLIDFDLPLEEAVHAARLHHEHQELNLEPNFVGKHLASDNLKVVEWKESAMFFGGVHTILKKEKQYTAVGDTRREGFAMEV